MVTQEEYEEDICELDTILNEMVISGLRNNTLGWSEEETRKVAVKYSEAWLQSSKELDAIKRTVAEDRQLSNRQTNELLRSKWPLQEIEWME
jgi:hypothetical protein